MAGVPNKVFSLNDEKISLTDSAEDDVSLIKTSRYYHR